MAERVDIANMALSLIGVEEITSLDDDSERARQVKLHYETARDSTLEAHDWSFAIERFEPAKLTATPVYGAGALFAVPVNILRVIACDNTAAGDPSTTSGSARINSLEQIDWVLEGQNIVCDEEIVYARGIRRIEDEGQFSPLFVQAFAAKLAMLLAVALSASANIQERVTGWYEYATREARTVDGMQGRSRRIRQRIFQKVR